MNGLISDVNFQGHLDRLVFVLRSPAWVEIWESYNLKVFPFAHLGLRTRTRDRIVWERCQAERLLLITDNRNEDGADSLSATIRDAGPDTLPVVTIGNSQRVLEDPSYARVVAAELMNLIDDIFERPECVLGVGRIFLPKNPV